MEILSLFAPEPIYKAGQHIATIVASTLTPVLLIISMAFRALEEQLNLLAGEAKWMKAFKEFLIFGFVIGAYFGLMSLIAAFMNPIYAWVDSFGSMQAIAQEYKVLYDSIKTKQAAGETSFLNQLASISLSPATVITLMASYFTYLLVTVLVAFLRIAHAMGFSLVVIYGLIALPLSLTNSLRLLKGWGIALGFFLLWPVVEGIFIGLLSVIFTDATSQLIANPNQSIGMDMVDVNTTYAVLNVLLALVLVAAPLVTGALVTNHSLHSALVAPFIAGAAAAGGVIVSRLKGRSSAGRQPSGQGERGPSVTQLARDLRARPIPQTPVPATLTTIPAATAASATTAATPTNQAQQRQRRRGVIIHQNRKKPT